MIIEKEINGYMYEIEVPENYLIAKKISGFYPGYKIFQETSGYLSKLYLQEVSYLKESDKKLIGTLLYSPENDVLTLYKIVNPKEHLHIKSHSFGINNEIIKNLRTSDRIVINDGVNTYSISVSKAMKVGQYLHFTDYELQLFIPVKEFRVKPKK